MASTWCGVFARGKERWRGSNHLVLISQFLCVNSCSSCKQAILWELVLPITGTTQDGEGRKEDEEDEEDGG